LIPILFIRADAFAGKPTPTLVVRTPEIRSGPAREEALTSNPFLLVRNQNNNVTPENLAPNSALP
jgi:hypothetical protein